MSRVTVFEVGPRDGLQNEKIRVSTQDKLALIAGLRAAGLKRLEIGAFVRPDRVPQMADSGEVFEKLKLPAGQPTELWALVPNRKGLERALAAGATHLALFTAASETFNQRNIGATIDGSFEVMADVLAEAHRRLGKKLKLRGYVSTAFGCPFEGPIAPAKTLRVVKRLAKLGVPEISIGDTIGVATPGAVEKLVRPALRELGAKRVAMHFHDTRGTALANALRSLELGVVTLDASAGGLGGCPFAPGATGNLATEDLVFMLQGMGVQTGVDLKKLCETSLALAKKMSRPLSSKYLQAYAFQCGEVIV